MQNDLKNIIESLLFVADSPIDIRTFKQIIPDADAKEIRQVIIELMAEYEARQGGFLLSEVAGGFQFRSRPDYKEWIKRMIKPSPVRLSKAALETLAIIAYHQPIIRSDVERIRGVDSGAILRGLLERKLVRILGKKEIPGRPLIYATTRRFLEIFNLKSLSDMPTLKEIQEFGKAEVAEFTAGLTEQQAQAEGESPPVPDTETPEGDETVFPEQGVEEPEGDDPGSARQDMESESHESESDNYPEEEVAAAEVDEPDSADLEEMDVPEDDEVVDREQDADDWEDDSSDESSRNE